VLNQNILKSEYLGCKDFTCEEEAFRISREKMKSNPATIIPEGGLNPHKVHRLWKQHQDLLPQYWQDIACPKPSDQPLLKVKKEKIMREDNNTKIKKWKRNDQSNVQQ